jgi:catechol 2,3-dioxygenase-like lactoylglutathione lyase family enzyme
MNVVRLGWMGTKTQQFDRMNEFYRDVLGLDVLSIDDSSGSFKLRDGTEVHVYGPKDEHHEFFGDGPVELTQARQDGYRRDVDMLSANCAL